MSYSAREMLRECVVPVLLGDNFSAHLFAARIYFLCGVSSYVCDDKRRALDFFSPFSRHYSLVARSDVALEALGYLSSQKELLPIIVPCDKYYTDFVAKNRDFLEARFVISDRESFFSLAQISALR